MVWFIVDDGFSEHPKTLAMSRTARLAAIGLWTMSGIWSSRQLTDGRLSSALVIEKGGRRAQIQVLVASGLWHDADSHCSHGPHHCPGVPDRDGLVFHDWFDWQRSRERILTDRRRKADAGRAGGKASGQARRGRSGSIIEAPASPVVEPPVPHPYPNPKLLTLVCRRLFGDARESTHADLLPLWQAAVGGGDLETELRNFLLHNADTHLHHPSAALLGWLSTAAERAATPSLRPVLGCADCTSGWLPDHPDTGMPVPCPTCKPHRYSRSHATGTAP